MTILQQPDSLSLSGNLKDFRIQTTDAISFILSQGKEEIVSRSFEPGADGIVIVNVRDIVHARLSFLFKNTSMVYEQTTIVSTFTAVVSGTEVTFTAIRCGIDMFADTATNFLTQNFLTWQPNIKPVTYYSPEFLTYYATQDCKVKLHAYFTDSSGAITTQTDLDLAGLSKGKAYTIPLQYASVLEKLENKMPAYYDVYIADLKGNRLTYIQRYYASDIKSETEQWVLFENSLGGIDTFRAYGSTAFTGEHTHNIAEIDEISLEYRVDTSRKFQKDTGYLGKKERIWLLDFFPSLKKYLYTGDCFRSIVVVESNVTYTDKELPSNYTFTYKYADARPLLNIPRADIPAGALNIVVPDVGSFTVPPRLVEFPRLPLSEGVLFPVQEPYSETWNATTAGSLCDFIAERIAQNYGGGGGVGHQHDNIDLLNLLGYTAEYLLLAGKKVKAGYADQAYTFQENTAQENIKFAKGLATDLISSMKYAKGEAGHGYRLGCDPETGESILEIDKLSVRLSAEFKELLIESLKHVGGALVVSPARIQCTKVEELSDNFRCYFDPGNNSQGRYDVDQAFTVGALARCEVFSGGRKKFYWRQVSYIGIDYIGLSKTECADGSDSPEPGDVIVQFGHATNPDLMDVQVISSIGSDSPSFKQYVGINSFVLPEPETVLCPGNNKITGILHLEDGSTGAGNLSDLPEEVVKAVDLGSVNILRNSGFTGEYDHEVLDESTELSEYSEMHGKKLKHWTGIASVQEDDVAVSGFAVTLGSLSQSVKLITNENYIVSYKAKGESVAVSCGSFSISQNLTSTYGKYNHRFKFVGDPIFLISGTAILCDLKLERGTIATDWASSPLDNDKSLSEIYSLQYLSDSIKNGSVDILGGLIMANMLQLGNYSNGKLQKVTAGISGIYIDDDDVAEWGGGTFEQAIRAVMMFKDNPSYQPTEEDLKSIAKFVVTHGGRTILNDVVLRGYIYALGGIFKGKVEIAGGKILLNEDGSGKLANGSIYWDTVGNLYRKSREIIVWRRLEEEITDAGITDVYNIKLEDGTFLMTVGYSSIYINLPDPSLYPDLIIEVENPPRTRTIIDFFTIKCDVAPIQVWDTNDLELKDAMIGAPIPDKGNCLIRSRTVLRKGWRWVANNFYTVE